PQPVDATRRVRRQRRPVDAKLVQHLGHPGTNYTGMSHLASELVGTSASSSSRMPTPRPAYCHPREAAVGTRTHCPIHCGLGQWTGLGLIATGMEQRGFGLHLTNAEPEI